ncbi:MAG: DUF488 family protein [Rubrimonas sp.]
MSGPAVFTIGYAAATVPGLIAALRAAGVARVLDVRAVAASRRAGFSKTVLAASLAAEGIGYVHLRALGTPKAGREAARAGRIAEMRAIFAGQLSTPEGTDALSRAAVIAAERPTALLCWCETAAKCHRAVVAERLTAALGATVVDL